MRSWHGSSASTSPISVKRAGGNLSQAARIAGLERKFLYKLLERAGLRHKEVSDDPAE